MVDGTVLAAYTIFNDAQDRLAAVVDRYAAVDPQHAGAEVQGIQRDTQQRLVALVGEDTAGALLRAAQRLSVSLQQPSSTNLRE
jgi:predicted component of type VI protein secretion system